MKTVFFRTLLSIMAALSIFIIVMLFIQIYGFGISVKKWEKEKIASIKLSVDKIITDAFKSDNTDFELLFNRLQPVITGTSFLSLYDKSKEPLFVVQKKGGGQRRRDIHKEDKIISSGMIPVYIDNEIKAYYVIHILSYNDDVENENFFTSIRNSFFAGIAISFFFGTLSALWFSRTFSMQSKKVASALDRISHGNLDVFIEEKGIKEISIIAKSANILKDKLKKEKELRDQWALDIAHDLRTPVTAVKTQLEAVLDKALHLDDNRIRKILDEAGKIEVLINELAELTNLESPELSLNPEKIISERIFSEIENTFLLRIKEKNIDFKVKNTLDEFTADRKLFIRSLMNIADNAVKFTPVGGTIELNAYPQDGQAVISIKNSGTYISEPESVKIFDRLYRADQARNTKGFGLGLSITKKIIELHGGDIRVESSKKDGTNFIIFLKKLPI